MTLQLHGNNLLDKLTGVALPPTVDVELFRIGTSIPTLPWLFEPRPVFTVFRSLEEQSSVHSFDVSSHVDEVRRSLALLKLFSRRMLFNRRRMQAFKAPKNFERIHPMFWMHIQRNPLPPARNPSRFAYTANNKSFLYSATKFRRSYGPNGNGWPR